MKPNSHLAVQPAKLSYQSGVIKQSYQTVNTVNVWSAISETITPTTQPPHDHNHPRGEAERETPAKEGCFSVSVQII